MSATGGMLLHLCWTVRQLLHGLQNCVLILSDTCIILHVCSRFRAKYAEMT